jgi:2-keto-4-pentenoate hydratase/2-oxohepta-3-ene-1,7-dioic acid hydratase in catechol pathway
MKIVRFLHDGREQVGLAEDGALRPLGDEYAAIVDVINDRDGARAAAAAAAPIAREQVSLRPPVDQSSRVFAVAQNYRDHAQETSGTDVPPAPIIFLKPMSALVGDGEPISLPAVTSFLDYEAELAVVVGRHARAVGPEAAADVVFGATCFNDVTGRDLQPALLGGKEQIDWFSAKSLDQSSPVGPWIVSRDELEPELDELGIRCRVNGETVQEDRTSSMVRGIAELVSFISQRVALQPGDLIATGTPGGVGRARGVNLKDGDLVEVEIDGVGVLRNRVKAAT